MKRNLIEEGITLGDTLYRQSDGKAFIVDRVESVAHPLRVRNMPEIYWLRADGLATGTLEWYLPEMPEVKNGAEDSVWEFESADNTFLQVTHKEGSFEFYTDCERWEEVKLANVVVCELIDWLSLRLDKNPLDNKNLLS